MIFGGLFSSFNVKTAALIRYFALPLIKNNHSCLDYARYIAQIQRKTHDFSAACCHTDLFIWD